MSTHPAHDPNDPRTNYALNPWIPMSCALDLKVIGKLGEETCELGAAIFRCVIQGVDECEPITLKPNRQWLTEEVADVLANIELVTEHFGLDVEAIRARVAKKKAHLRGWHAMVPT